ncbi:ankyrin repeat domain-containing protein [Candidatus Enterococcus ferrettii]|uniref:Ankyrin repeat protein n=1 Tax=Candidatus Enterococcus ferrettii TaxID=2815324 RepID=A0ABV0EPJ8_9ENTE|nr:ankyrin repeat domain-containing protein [Enterococcus sp. 665A]MBO1338877.1 ankyrin repeat domain-containing protein [Enterococcus sp. 665A]
MGLFDKFKKRVAPRPTTEATSEPKKQRQDTSSSNKRKTLPKKFDDMLKNENIDTLKAVFDKCELDAYGGYYRQTALAYTGIPDELTCWLVDQGADINAKDSYGNAPLHRQSAAWHSNIQLLIDLGADIESVNNQGKTPLHTAACAFIPEHVQTLVNNRATIGNQSKREITPLSMALGQCQNLHINRMAEITEILINAGTPVTKEMKKEVERIGKSFEFFRNDISTDILDEMEAGLASLYEAFNVLPVPKREVHDGLKQIKVRTKCWQDQHQELWDLLVPGSGHAKTVQGEVIRITGRVSDEIYRNGGANWDGDYHKMLKSLQQFLNTETPLSPKQLQEVNEMIKILYGGSGEEESARLTELTVKWVLANPAPIPMEEPEYER